MEANQIEVSIASSDAVVADQSQGERLVWIEYREGGAECCILAVREKEFVLVDLQKRVWLNYSGQWRWGGGLSAIHIEDEPDPYTTGDLDPV